MLTEIVMVNVDDMIVNSADNNDDGNDSTKSIFSCYWRCYLYLTEIIVYNSRVISSMSYVPFVIS